MALKHIGKSYSKKDFQEYITTAKPVTKQANLPNKVTSGFAPYKPDATPRFPGVEQMKTEATTFASGAKAEENNLLKKHSLNKSNKDFSNDEEHTQYVISKGKDFAKTYSNDELTRALNITSNRYNSLIKNKSRTEAEEKELRILETNKKIYNNAISYQKTNNGKVLPGERYSAIKDNEGFEVLSQYNKSIAEDPSEFHYKYVNAQHYDWDKTPGEKNLYNAIPTKTESFYDEYRDQTKIKQQLYVHYMEDDERKTYNYIYNTKGREAAEQYLDHLYDKLLERRATEVSKQSKEFAKEKPLEAAAVSIMQTPINFMAILDTAANAVMGDKVDTNSIHYDVVRSKNDIAQGLTEDKGPIASLLIQTGLSMGDMITALPFGAGGSLMVLGSNAASSSAYDAVQRGASAREALTVGVAAGAIEAITEKIGIDNLFKIAKLPPSTWKQAIKTIAKQAGAEGMEEFVSEILNNITDEAVMGEKSNYNKLVNRYVENGYSENDAIKKAFTEIYVAGPLKAALGGMISGGIFGAGAVGLSSASNPSLGKDIKKSKDASVVIERAIEYGINSEDKAVRKIATRVYEQSEDGIENVSNKDLGALVRSAFENKYNVFTGTEIVEEAPEPKKTFGEKVKGAVDVVKDAFGISNEQTTNAPITPSTEGSNMNLPKRAEQPQIKAPVSTEVSINAPIKTVDVQSAIERITSGTATNKDYDLFKPANAKNRQMFEDATGVKLPATNSETRKYLREYVQNGLNNSTESDIIETDGGVQYGQRDDGGRSGRAWSEVESAGKQSTSVSDWRQFGTQRVNESIRVFDEVRPDSQEVVGRRRERVTWNAHKNNGPKSDAEIFIDNEAKKYGVEVEYATDLTVTSANGKVTHPVAFAMGNKVVVSDKATFKDVAHEFVHHIRKTNPRKYNAIRSYIKNNIKSGLYDFAFDSYKTMYSEVYDFGDFDAMTDEERARATDIIEEELVCDITAYNKVGQGTPIVNEEEFTQLVDELFDTAKETISYTSTENQNNAKPKKSPVKDFLGKLDFLPLPKTKNGNVKRNITQTTAEQLINIVDEYAKTGQINQQMANALFDTLYNSSVVESVENFDEAINYIKNTKLYISPEDKGTIPDFNKFRQSMFKKLDITTDDTKGGLSTDVFFDEFTSLFPGMVDETLTHPADQLQALANFVTDAKSKQTQTLDDYFGEGAESAKEQMHEMFTEELEAFVKGEEIRYAVASSEREGAFVMSEDEIKRIQGIGRKSINKFSAEEIEITKKFAQKFFEELGVKSPFFRAWFGDWRINDKTSLEIVEIYETKQKNPRGQFVNKDTGFSINSSSVGYEETISHSGKDKLSVIAMQNIDRIIENAVLLDTEVSEYGRGKKSIYTCFMHKFYAPIYIDGKPCIAKLTVDESYQPGAEDTNKKFYHVRAIKIEPVSSVGIGFNHTPIMDKSGSTIIVADLFNIVKQYDKEFNPKDCSLILNEDGTPKVVYHGTDGKFYVFDMSKGRANMDIQGSFFSPWEIDAQGYGKNVGAYYLSIKKPADGPTAYAALNKFKGQNNAGVKAKEYLIKQGYDGVNFYDEEYVAFYPTQIKSATDNIGTFDSNNPDVRYSTGTTEKTAEYYNQRYAELLEEYGAIKKGAQPRVEESETPKRSSQNKYVSQHARTMAESGLLKGEMEDEFKKMVVEGKMSHEVFTDKMAEKGAEARVKFNGFDESVDEFKSKVKSGGMNKEDIALGQMLFNLACQNKDTKLAMELAIDLSLAATQFGQNVQAFSMLKKMSPDGQLYYLEKSLQKINRDLLDQYKGKFKEIKIDQKLAEDLLNSKSQEEMNDAVHAIEKNIGEQMPSNFADKLNAWRYLSMLGNTRTHFRNILGNAVFYPAVKIKDYIGATIEKALPKAQRTKSFTKTEDSKDFASKDWEVMKEVVKGNDGKYGLKQGVEEYRKIFNPKWLEALRKFNSNALNTEDEWFLAPYYKSAFAQAMTARGLTSEFLNSGTKEANEQLTSLRKHALEEAQRGTYRDTNAFSELVGNLKFKGKGKASAIGNVFVEGVLPFKKTPANILVRGIEYSPIGVVKSLYDMATKVRKGDMSASKAIDELSAGLVGTAVVGLGYLMCKAGMLVVEPDEDDEVSGYKKMLGAQNYALKIGDHTYTIDWMAPAALPLFVGAEMFNTVDNTEKMSFTALCDALTRISEPALELSCLSGVQSALESIKYAEKNEIVWELLGSMATSYVQQAIPTFGGQFARTIDNTKRNAYYKDKNSNIPEFLNGFIQQAAAKIPGATRLLPEKIDRWGRTEKYGSLPERALENFVSPGYYSNDKSTLTDKKLMDLYEKTGEESILPDVAAKSFKVDGEYEYLSADEYVEYSKIRGSLSYEYITKFMTELGTNTLDNSKKVEVIKSLYGYANAKAKTKVSDYALDEHYQKVEKAKNAGISPEKFYVAYHSAKGFVSDKNSKGNSIQYSKSRKEMKAIKKNVKGLSEKSLYKLFEIMGYSENQIKDFRYNLPRKN